MHTCFCVRVCISTLCPPRLLDFCWRQCHASWAFAGVRATLPGILLVAVPGFLEVVADADEYGALLSHSEFGKAAKSVASLDADQRCLPVEHPVFVLFVSSSLHLLVEFGVYETDAGGNLGVHSEVLFPEPVELG